jgi:hypothetical protein
MQLSALGGAIQLSLWSRRYLTVLQQRLPRIGKGSRRSIERIIIGVKVPDIVNTNSTHTMLLWRLGGNFDLGELPLRKL